MTRFGFCTLVLAMATSAFTTGCTSDTGEDADRAPAATDDATPPSTGAEDVGKVSDPLVAPGCVKLRQEDIDGWVTRSWAQAINDCSGDVRLRFIWAWAPDGACITIPSGHRYAETRTGYGPYVSELRRC